MERWWPENRVFRDKQAMVLGRARLTIEILLQSYITPPPLLPIISNIRAAPLFTNTNARSSRLEAYLKV